MGYYPRSKHRSRERRRNYAIALAGLQGATFVKVKAMLSTDRGYFWSIIGPQRTEPSIFQSRVKAARWYSAAWDKLHAN
jgi:hypothetical protein